MLQLIDSLINGVDLSESQAEDSLNILLNEADEALISAFLVLLRAKGETYEEVWYIDFNHHFVISLVKFLSLEVNPEKSRNLSLQLHEATLFECQILENFLKKT